MSLISSLVFPLGKRDHVKIRWVIEVKEIHGTPIQKLIGTNLHVLILFMQPVIGLSEIRIVLCGLEFGFQRPPWFSRLANPQKEAH